ncbi:MAG: DNA-binding protein [Lachnospiraceae bacterium]|nr:DNA-binding protein [Lachnospiraceae bacterium]
MDKNYEHAILYDFYGALLTKKQQQIYEEVRFGDLSLSEASEQFGISRQGIHDALRRVEMSLEAYEEKLKLVNQFRQVRNKAEEIRRLCRQMEEQFPATPAIQGILRLTREIEDLS